MNATNTFEHASQPQEVVSTHWLTLIRIAVIVILVVVNVIFVLSIPHFYTRLTTPCELPNCKPLVLTSDDVAMLESVGLSAGFYAVTQLIIEIANALLINLFCIYFLRQVVTHWLGHIASLTLIQFILMLNVFWAFSGVHTEFKQFSELIYIAPMSATLFLMYTFPNGRFVPRFSVAFLVLGIVSFVSVSSNLHYDNFTGRDLSDLSVYPFIIAILAGVVFQIYRYFYVANEVHHRQMRWVVVGFLGFATGILGWMFFIEYLAFQPDMPRVWIHIFTMPVITILTVVPLTLALLLAIVQESLWNIDVVVNRTVVYVVVITIVFATYIFVISLLNVVFDISNNILISLIATGLVALSFKFVAQRTQWAINRLIFGQREEPQAVLENLSRQLQTATSLDNLLQTSAMTISQSLKIPYVVIAIRHDKDVIMQTEYGKNRFPTRSYDLIYRNEVVGELMVGQRSPNEPLNSADHAVIAGIAQQMGAVVYAVRLQSDLQLAREKLVMTREEERRRIRRDLHDGLGPTLASQTLQLDVVLDTLMENDVSTASHQVEQLKSQTQQMVADIRRLVYELRPPALDELGLLEALQSHVVQMKGINGLHISIKADPDPLPTLPAAIEVAAYRIILEGITNVIRHARAQNCKVRFQLFEDAQHAQLILTITDDGIGLPKNLRSGVGLTSMRERAEELGGTFEIKSNPPKGTTFTAKLIFMIQR